MKAARSYRRQARQFESLEGRMMMAGNVTASLSGGCLQLCGDTKNNIIAVTQLSSGDWSVTGLLGTKICGQKSATFCNVCSINAKLDCGNDVVAVFNGCLPCDLCIDTSKGNDAVVLLHLNVGNVSVNTGVGNDLLVAVGVTACQTVATASVTTNTFSPSCSTACFDTGDGMDLVFLAGIHSDNLSLCTGKGIDFVGLLDVCANNCLNVDTGAGFDLLAVVHCNADNAKFCGGNDSGDIMATALNCFDSSSSNFKLTFNFDALAKSIASSLKGAKTTLLKSLSSVGCLPDLKF